MKSVFKVEKQKAVIEKWLKSTHTCKLCQENNLYKEPQRKYVSLGFLFFE